MAETYYELLRRPEWQRKRLEVMQRAKFRCESCFAADKTLNVHHRYYTKGAKPWEYPDEVFQCLCEPCHGERHGLADELKRVAGSLTDGDLANVLGYARAVSRISESCGSAFGDPVAVGSFDEAIGAVLAFAVHVLNEVPHLLSTAGAVAELATPTGFVTDSSICGHIIDAINADESRSPATGSQSGWQQAAAAERMADCRM